MRAFAVLNTRNIYTYIVKSGVLPGGFEEKKTRDLRRGSLCSRVAFCETFQREKTA